MRHKNLSRFTTFIIFAITVTLPLSSARAETLVGTNVDSRVLVGFTVDPVGVQPWLPEGWTPVPFPAGPLKGANVLMVLIDRAVQLDAEAKPTLPPNSRYAVLAGLGTQVAGDAVRLYVYRLYATDTVPNPYGNSVKADVTRYTSTEGPAEVGRLHKEEWSALPEAGGELKFSLNYITGKGSWSPGEANPYSNTNIDFSRIYRFEQLLDLAMSTAIGKPLNGEFNFSSDIAELDKIFNGSEKVVAILNVPVYVRKVFLP